MKRLYFFDKQFNYKDVIVINNFNPIVDIISTQSFKIETPLMPVVASGDICILKDNNEVVFIGNILNVEESEKKTKTITISYIDELFNINGEVADLSGNIISWITDTLTANFISVSDNLQKISLSIVNNCSTAYSGTYTFESTNIKDCLRNIFNYSGVYIDFDIEFANNGNIESLICNIRSNVEEETIKLKYNMPIISDIKRTVTNNQNVNKLVLLPDDTVTGGNRYEFYLLKDGTISTDASNVNRFENVKQEIQYYDENFTAESLLNSAKEVLGGQQFNHAIGFYILHKNNFYISPYKKILFYDKNNIVYNSIITKIQYNSEFDYIELGVVRLKLTDKLQKEKSKSTSSSSGGGGSYVLPQATASTLGGIIAETKTTETNEVKIDTATGKLYSKTIPTSSTDLSDTSNIAYKNTENTFSQDQTYSAFLKVLGTAADRHLITRGIGGCSADGATVDDLYVNYGQSKGLKWGSSAQGYLNSNGGASFNERPTVNSENLAYQSEIPTKLDDLIRISKQGYISSGYQYFELATLPIDNSGNYASTIFSGRIGGWVGTSNVAYFTALLSNRSDYSGNNVTASIEMLGKFENALPIATIVAYKQTDLSAKLYLKATSYYTFDFSFQKYQSTVTYDYTGTAVTPTGTLIWDMSTAPKFAVDTTGQISNGTYKYYLPSSSGTLALVGESPITLLDVYPVGAIYMSVSATSPASLFGGTWSSFGEGRVLIGMGNNDETDYTTVESTGGSENSVATHTHTQNSHNHTQNSHMHRVYSVDTWSYNVIGLNESKARGVGAVEQTSGNTNYYTNMKGTSGQIIESSTATNIAATATNQDAGISGGNRMPFITVYMWKRTA